MPTQGKPLAASRRFIARHVAPLAKHPGLTLLVGVALLVTGFVEVLEEVMEFDSFLGAHHGVFILGFVTIVRSLVELAEGIAWLSIEEEAG